MLVVELPLLAPEGFLFQGEFCDLAGRVYYYCCFIVCKTTFELMPCHL